MAKNDGGPAFPRTAGPKDVYGNPTNHAQSGMSLRDHFAGIALTRLKYDPSKSHAHTAAEAYLMADAMISERAK